jgi:predicted lipoprotein
MGRSRFACSLAVTAVAACGSDSSPQPPSEELFDRRAMLAHLGNELLLPIQADFAARSAELPIALSAHCDALDAGTSTSTLPVAQAKLSGAVDAWQRADALLIGPAAMDGKALRGMIYGWPLLSACDLDRDVASRWADPASYDVTKKLLNARSLSAVEYLLYPQTATHACVSTPVGWDALGADLPSARCRLALAIATDVAAHGAQLHASWRADGGNYVGQLATAGTAGSSLPSAHAAVNQLSDAMFYVDGMVKDMKLAEAAGIAVNACETVQTPCLREVELRFADRSTFAIRANLSALREAFTGTTTRADGPGFDDFLVAVGHAELATANLDTAIAQAAALPDSFLTALDQEYAKVVSTHAAVRSFTDDLKSQFLTVLALEIPDDAATDND